MPKKLGTFVYLCISWQKNFTSVEFSVNNIFFLLWILDVYIDVPDIIDISHMRSKGLQPGEEILPESSGDIFDRFELFYLFFF